MATDVLFDDEGNEALVVDDGTPRDPLGLHLRIEQVAPRVFFPYEAIRSAMRRTCHPDIVLDGDLLRINGIDQRVVYRLTKDPSRDGYIGEWPD